MKSFEEEDDVELKGYLDFVRKGFEEDARTNYEEIVKEDLNAYNQNCKMKLIKLLITTFTTRI